MVHINCECKIQNIRYLKCHKWCIAIPYKKTYDRRSNTNDPSTVFMISNRDTFYREYCIFQITKKTCVASQNTNELCSSFLLVNVENICNVVNPINPTDAGELDRPN